MCQVCCEQYVPVLFSFPEMDIYAEGSFQMFTSGDWRLTVFPELSAQPFVICGDQNTPVCRVIEQVCSAFGFPGVLSLAAS